MVDEYEAENGPIEITYNATSDEENVQTAELTAELYADVGIDVNINQIEQSAYITDALQGNFETIGWRLHGGFDADVQNVWWNSENAEEIGALSLNFGRFTDEVIDENLAIIRASPDADERREAAEAINRRFGEQLYNLWADWVTWGTAHQPFVHNVGTGLDLPEGATSADHGWRGTGVVNLSNLWVDQ